MKTANHPAAAPQVRLTWQVAGSFPQRLRGLLKSPPPAAGAALLIAPCKAVHTIGMRHSIDIVFVSRGGGVLRVCPDVAPQRARMCWRAWGVAELAAGEARRLGIATGQSLVMPP